MSNQVFQIGANGFEKIDHTATLKIGTVLWFEGYGQNGRESIVTEDLGNGRVELITTDGKNRSDCYASTLKPWGSSNGIGYYYPPEPVTPWTEKQVTALVKKFNTKQAKEQAERNAANDKAEKAKAEGREKLAQFLTTMTTAQVKKIKGVIVATLKENDSDPMTDYFNHTNKRHVVLAFTNKEREDFRELRKAALTFKPTAHLDGKEFENRDNYSMGHGYWLGEHLHSGWEVTKNCYSWEELCARVLGNNPDDFRIGNAKLVTKPEPKVKPEQVETVTPTPVEEKTIRVEVVEFDHDYYGHMTKVQIYFPDKPSAEVRAELKEKRFRWYKIGKCWSGNIKHLDWAKQRFA